MLVKSGVRTKTVNILKKLLKLQEKVLQTINFQTPTATTTNPDPIVDLISVRSSGAAHFL